jgi:tetratricopeptide (TPR) repeat protein
MINCHRAIFQSAITVTLTFLLTAPLASDQAQSSDNSFAITGVNVLPMDENRVLQNQTVIVINGTVEVIGDSASTIVPAEIRIIEGNGQYLMPGLADLHVHILHEDDFVNYLAWGVTTVMHLGGSGISGSDVLRHRNEIAAGKTLGPNIYTTNRIFDGDPRLNGASIELTDPDTAREEVRKLKADGFDFIKIYNNLAQPEFEATVDEAQKAGLSVIGHIPRKFDTLIALSGGQNAIAHTEELFFSYFEGPRSTDDHMSDTYEPDMARLEPLIDVMVTNDVAVMPDLAFTFTDLIMWDDLEIIWNDSDFPYLHPATASMWESGNINRRSNIENFVIREQWKYELMLELTRQFQQAGILQVIGTDAAIPGLYPGKAAHRELTELVKAGLSNYDAMAIGTRNAGEFARRYIDRDVRFGQVLPGYRADLVLVDGNPLEKTRYDFLRGANNRVDAALEKAGGKETIQQMIDANPGDTEFLSSIEARINAAGYSAAFANNLDRSEEILRLNTRLFPKSANTWDSLAEVTLYRGNREAALEFYRKALQADPGFENAAEQIEKILSDSD